MYACVNVCVRFNKSTSSEFFEHVEKNVANKSFVYYS